jgi:two-component system response regulator RpfG
MVTVGRSEVRDKALEAGASDLLSRLTDQYECRARCRNLLTLRRQQKIIPSARTG